MSVVRRFRPENRLAKLLETPGGVSVGQALSKASAALESIRESCMQALDQKLVVLANMAERPANASRDEAMYLLANEIFNESGSFGLSELSAAAYSLCTLLDSEDRSSRRAAAIRVHIDSMRALRHPDMAGDQAARAAVLEGLRNLTARQIEPLLTEEPST
jgi:hypothetical protein